MAKITIPIPMAIDANGDHWGIEFDPGDIKSMSMERGTVIVPTEHTWIHRESDGTMELRLKFEGPGTFPLWVIVKEDQDVPSGDSPGT